MPAGRPRIYDNIDELAEMVESYFLQDVEGQSEKIPNAKPTVTGLALHLGFADKTTLYEYRDRSELSYPIKKALTFDVNFKSQVKAQMDPKGIIFGKPTIAISIRRGDYVGNPNYRLLPITYYILAMFENFPNWRDHNIVIFSDDIPYCKVHWDCIPNVYFSENNSDIEDLCLMTLCDDFIIANSSFSWWGAYLGEKEGSRCAICFSTG